MQSRASAIAPNHSAPQAAPSPAIEGPAPAPTLEDRWLRRDRKLKTATFATLGITGASAIGIGVAGGVLNAHDQQTGDGSSEAKGLVAAGVVFGAALLALSVSGVLWQDHRYKRPESLEASSQTVSALAIDDPRRSPWWVERDRRLTRGVIGTGVLFGLSLAGLTVSFGLLFAPSDERNDKASEFLGTVIMAPITAAALIPLAILGGMRRSHREWLPSTKASVSVTPGGFRIAF